MRYYAHGKLLLSGEYLVLKGAQALAIPTRYGQSLSFLPDGKNLYWQSFDHENKLWFEVEFNSDLNVISSNDSGSANFLKRILEKAANIKGTNLPFGKVEMHLEFPRNWGLGSSSTLTHLVAQWLEVDPFELFFSTQNGSGYDIACASSKTPLIYTLNDGDPHHQSAVLPSVFEDVFFIHLNKKQNSRPAVTNFLKTNSPAKAVAEISEITKQMLTVQTTPELMKLMDLHEAIMSEILQTPAIKGSLFPDFNGSIKSLGAWGGDFVMAIGENVPEYFKAKGFPTILSFDNLVLK